MISDEYVTDFSDKVFLKKSLANWTQNLRWRFIIGHSGVNYGNLNHLILCDVA